MIRIEDPFIRGAPDVVAEVSSPSSRELDRGGKRELYGFGVPEYWCVDLEAEQIEVYRLNEIDDGPAAVLDRSGRLTSPLLPGFDVAVADVLGVNQGT